MVRVVDRDSLNVLRRWQDVIVSGLTPMGAGQTSTADDQHHGKGLGHKILGCEPYGLHGVQLVVSDAYVGLAVAARASSAPSSPQALLRLGVQKP